MGMTLVKKTDTHRIYKRRDDRYAVKDAEKRPVNGDEKVAVLLAEGLVEAPAPKQPEPEAPAAEEAAEEASADEAPAEEAAAEDAEADDAE